MTLTKSNISQISSKDVASDKTGKPRKQYNMRRSTKDWGSVAKSQISKNTPTQSPTPVVYKTTKKTNDARLKKSTNVVTVPEKHVDINLDNTEVASIPPPKKQFIPQSEEKQDEIDVTTDSDNVVGPSPPRKITKKRTAKEILQVKINPKKTTASRLQNIPPIKKPEKSVNMPKKKAKTVSSTGEKEKSAEDKMVEIQQEKLKLMSDYYKNVSSVKTKDTSTINKPTTEVQTPTKENDSSDSVLALWARMHLKKMQQIPDEEVRDKLMEHITHVTNLAIRGKWPMDSEASDFELQTHNVPRSQVVTSSNFRRPQSEVDSDNRHRVNDSTISGHSTPQPQFSEHTSRYPLDTGLFFYPGFMPRPKPMYTSSGSFANTSQHMQFANAQTGELHSPILSRELQEEIASLIGRSPVNPVYCHNYNQYGHPPNVPVDNQLPRPQLHPQPTRILENPNMQKTKKIVDDNNQPDPELNVSQSSIHVGVPVNRSQSVTPSSEINTDNKDKEITEKDVEDNNPDMEKN